MLNSWNGVEITQSERDQWADELVARMQEHPEKPYWYMLSGDSLVLVCRNSDRLEVFDCKMVRRGSLKMKPPVDKIKCPECGISVPDVPADSSYEELLCNRCYDNEMQE